MRYLFMSAAILFAFAPFAQAQGTGNGLSYTTKGGERTGGHMNFMAPKYEDEKKEPLKPYGAKEDPAPTEEEKAAEQTWEKYKALAAGQYKEEEPVKKSISPEATSTKEQPTGATGLTSILEEYRKNKANRSQMRVIRVAEPEKEKTTEEPKKEEPDESAKKSGE
jgi:hypothetical protein